MFEVTEAQKQKINTWLETVVYPRRVDQQRSDPTYLRIPFITESWDRGYPYEGVSGGALTYEFTPTSIGVILKVSYSKFPDSLDVTDYENW